MMSDLKNIIFSNSPIKGVKPASIIFPDDKVLLTSIKNILESIGLDKYSAFIRVFVDNEKIALTDPIIANIFLPKEDERSLEEYDLRVSKSLNNKEYYIYLPHIFFDKSDIRTWKYDISKTIYDCAPAKINYFSTDCFLGNYSRTPINIHLDHVNVLYLQVYGNKKFLFWDSNTIEEEYPEYIIKDTNSKNGKYSIEKSCEKVVLENPRHQLAISSGDFVFWPANSWHIAIQEKNFTFSLGINWIEYSTANLDLFKKSNVLIVLPNVERRALLPFNEASSYEKTKHQTTNFNMLNGVLSVSCNGHSTKFPNCSDDLFEYFCIFQKELEGVRCLDYKLQLDEWNYNIFTQVIKFLISTFGLEELPE
jgi:hypothetical protein